MLVGHVILHDIQVFLKRRVFVGNIQYRIQAGNNAALRAGFAFKLLWLIVISGHAFVHQALG